MNEHITQTAADLRVEAGRLNEMASVLDQWARGRDLEAALKEAPLVQASTLTPRAVALVGGEPLSFGRPRRRGPAAHQHRPSLTQGKPGSIEALIVESVDGLTSPFTCAQVIAAAADRHPDHAKRLRADAVVGYHLTKLRTRGWLEVVEKRRGNQPMGYGKTKAFGGLTEKERAYRELRAGMPTPTPEGE